MLHLRYTIVNTCNADLSHTSGKYSVSAKEWQSCLVMIPAKDTDHELPYKRALNASNPPMQSTPPKIVFPGNKIVYSPVQNAAMDEIRWGPRGHVALSAGAHSTGHIFIYREGTVPDDNHVM